MAPGRFVVLTVALLGALAPATRAQGPKLDAETLRGRELAALLEVRTVLMAQKLFAPKNGGYFGPFECLSKPETCLQDFPKDEAPFLDPTHDWLVERRGYARSFQPGPKVVDAELQAAKAVPGSVRAFAFTAIPVVAGETGLRAFCGDAGGKICFTADGSPPGVRDGRCVAPCKELK
jgi:hypothetical protein